METSDRSTTPGGTHVRTHRHLRARHDALRHHAVQALRRQRPEAPGHIAGLLAQLRRHHALRPDEGPGAHRIRPRHHALRPSQQLRPRTRRRGEERGTADPAIPRRPPRRTGHQHQGRLRDVVGPVRRLGQPQIPARLTLPEPGTPGTRLRRHLLPSPSGPRDPSGGNDGRARPGRRQRQGALCGPVELRRATAGAGGDDPR